MALQSKPLIIPVIDENPVLADVAVAMFRAMAEQGLTEAIAVCPFCTDGFLHAGRVGNARRAKVECDACGVLIMESFRSAYGWPPLEMPAKI